MSNIDWELIKAYQKKRRDEIELSRAKKSNKARLRGFKPSSLIDALEGYPTLKEVSPKEFYRVIFDSETVPLESPGTSNKGEYHAIVQAINLEATKHYKQYQKEYKETNPKNYKGLAFRKVRKENYKFISKTFNFYDGCDYVNDIVNFENDGVFFFLSPISYIGEHRTKDNARMLYALAIELDNLVVDLDGLQTGFYSLMQQFGAYSGNWLPVPTLISWSGRGIHLYWKLKDPVPLYKANARTINKLRKSLVKRVWNSNVTELYQQKDIQYETLFQGFRMVGTLTKKGLKEGINEVCRGFRVGDGKEYSLEELFAFCPEKDIEHCKKIEEKPKHTIQQMRQEYGEEWVEEHYKNGKWKGVPCKYWQVNRAFYNSFLSKIEEETEEGHRYSALCMLCSVGWKCGVPVEEIEEDCFRLKAHFDSQRYKEPLKTEDVYDALKYLEKGNELYKFRADLLTLNAGVSAYEPNKRNGRKRKEHFEYVDVIRRLDGKPEWNRLGGRKPKKEIVVEWREAHPQGKKIDCEKETGLSRHTILKWWNEYLG